MQNLIFAHERNRETNNKESFTDDANNFIKLKYETILINKIVLYWNNFDFDFPRSLELTPDQ